MIPTREKFLTDSLKTLFQDTNATRPALTPIESNVYEYLYSFTALNTFQPSIREIGREFGFTNTAAVVKVLESLHEKGYIRRDSANARALTLQ